VKLPALPRGASVAKPSETAPKQLDLVSTEAQPAFALVATARSPIAIPPRASARGILAKASESDKRFTKSLMMAARATGISFFDHIIIGDNRYFSFADEGLIGEYKAVAIREL